MTERLIEALRDGGSLALTTDEAQSKASALDEHGFLVIDLEALPKPEEHDNGYGTQRRIGSVSLKTTWADDETAEAYAVRHMELALDHIAAAQWVLTNPPPAPPVYREERRVFLVWQESAERYPTETQYAAARRALYWKAQGANWMADYYDTARLLEVREDGNGFLHLFGVEVMRKVRVEEGDDDE
jgi:hypothetical protein